MTYWSITLLLTLVLLDKSHGMLNKSAIQGLYNTLVTTPTGVSKLLTELTEQVGFFFVLG